MSTADSAGCRWNETSAGDDQHQREDDSRQQDTREQHQRATDALCHSV